MDIHNLNAGPVDAGYPLEIRSKQSRFLPLLAVGFLALLACAAFWVTARYLGPDTALLNALERRDMAAADLALKHGANPNLKVEQCWPTHLLSDHVSFFYWKVRDPRDYGDWPLLLAETFRQDAASVRLLLAHRANADARACGISAFKIAKINGYKEILGLLEKAGARE
jgi:hypothetical protein